ncbi:MAG: hypothetical protein M9933_14140 [Chitinophagaceae bacterium]|nr:hypothetical protein [Chitinophagaceae bacterium]
MRCLLYLSCFSLLAGCSSAYKNLTRTGTDPGCVAAFKPHFSLALYQTRVNVAGRYLGGLLVIKTMPDSSVRMVFTNETGFTFFDFEFNKEQFKVHYIFRQMNRKAVIKTLRKDFKLVLMDHLDAAGSYTLKENDDFYRVFPDGKDFYYYITDSSCTELRRMERGSRKKKVMQAMVFPGGNGMPDSIGIQHYNFNFNIGLKRIEDDPER